MRDRWSFGISPLPASSPLRIEVAAENHFRIIGCRIAHYTVRKSLAERLFLDAFFEIINYLLINKLG